MTHTPRDIAFRQKLSSPTLYSFPSPSQPTLYSSSSPAPSLSSPSFSSSSSFDPSPHTLDPLATPPLSTTNLVLPLSTPFPPLLPRIAPSNLPLPPSPDPLTRQSQSAPLSSRHYSHSRIDLYLASHSTDLSCLRRMNMAT